MALTAQQTRGNSDSAPGRRGQPGDGRPGGTKGSALGKMPPSKTLAMVCGVLIANYLLMRFLIPGPEAPVTVPYTLFKEEAGKGNVEAIYSQGDTITGRFAAPVTYPPAGEKSAAPGGEAQVGERSAARAPRGPPKTVDATSRPPCPLS